MAPEPIPVLLPIVTDISTDYRCYKLAVSLRKMGYEPEILCDKPLHPPGPLWNSFRITPITHISHHRNFPLAFGEFILRLLPRLLLTRSRLWIALDCPPLLVTALMGRLRNRRVIYDSHELFLELPSVQRSIFRRVFWKFWHDMGIRLASSVMTVCPGFVDSLKQQFPAKKYFLLPNMPMGKDRQIPLKALPQGPVELIYQGYVRHNANLEILIDALVQDDTFRLTVAGGGTEFESLRAYADKAKMNGRVTFSGHVPFEDLPALTARAHIGINILLPLSISLDLTWPNKLFEYVRSGLPVLLSPTAGNKAFLKRHDVGVFADTDSVESILKGLREIVERYPELAANCVRAGKEMCWENNEKSLARFLTS